MNNSFKRWLVEEDGDMLDGAEKVAKAAADGLKGGYKDAMGNAKSDIEDADKKAADNKKANDNAKTATDSQETNAVIDFINKHTANLFVNFPYTDGPGGPADLLATFESRGAALQAFETYKNMAKTIEKIQQGFNKRLVQTGKIKGPDLKGILTRARSDAEAGMIDKETEAFAKSEAQFFTELLTIQKKGTTQDAFDKYKFDEQQFISRLSNRFSKTPPDKIGLAIASLNTLFTYLIEEFTKYAKTIAEDGSQRAKPTTNESIIQRYFLSRLL